MKTPPVSTTDFQYSGFRYRSIQEKNFAKIQIDRVIDMQKRCSSIKTSGDEQPRQQIIIMLDRG